MRLFISLLLLFVGATTFAQQREIKEVITNDFVPSKHALPESRFAVGEDFLGVKSMDNKEYRDSLAGYFDKIEEYFPPIADTSTHRYFQAIFATDTLCYKERKNTIRHQQLLEIESQTPPHQRFEVNIENLTESEIEILTHQMRQMKTRDRLMNNSQTCIFYALNLLLDSYQINPAPIITRNTNFVDGDQLPRFFDHILILKDSIPCKYIVLRKVKFSDRCILVFRNASNQYIHAVFHNNGIFYTKNGMLSPFILNDIRPITERYSRYDTPNRELSNDELDTMADTVLVFDLKVIPLDQN